MRLEAPYPGIRTTVILPDPTFSDSENETVSINNRRTMSGKQYVYIKTTARRKKLVFNLELAYQKSLELREFIKYYFSQKILLTDFNGNRWAVNFTSNPFEVSGIGPDEYTTIQLEVEGFKL